jgi:NAD+ kinase
MKIVLFTNNNKDTDGKVTAAASAVLRGAGTEPVIFDGCGSVFDGAYAALSVGGDGTFLRCAQYAAPRGVAVLGVHMGHTGYLARIRPEELDALSQIKTFAVRERSMLETGCGVSSTGHANGPCNTGALLAINDFTFSRGLAAQTVALELEADGHTLGSFLGDGVIVSSATGSTGYTLAAGGPVVDPCVNAIIVTPICAHILRTHAFVLAPERVLTVIPSQAERRPVYLSADGNEPRRLPEGARIDIRVSEKTLRCLEPEGNNFFENVRIHRL